MNERNILVAPFRTNNWKDYVLGFLFSPRGLNVVLIDKIKPDFQKGLYNGIGGEVESIDSSLNDAMSREFLEETGVAIDSERWIYFHTMNVPTRELSVYCFYTMGTLDEYLACETTTQEDIVKVQARDIQHFPIMTNLAWLVPMALDKHHHWSQSENKI